MQVNQTQLGKGMAEGKKPLIRGIMISCIAFAIIACVSLCAVSYMIIHNEVTDRYRSYSTDLLTLVSSRIDADDLAQCVNTGQKSQKYNDLQAFMDLTKESCKEVHFLSIVKPLNTNDSDNIEYIMMAAPNNEKGTDADQAVELGSLSGTSFPASTAKLHYDAMNSDNYFSFFEATTEWGIAYTATKKITTSKGEFVGLLCLGIDTAAMRDTTRSDVLFVFLLILLGSMLFTLAFSLYARKNITEPIGKLERSVSGFAYSRKGANGTIGVIEDPQIHTGNEVESLSNAVMKMSYDMRDYVDQALAAESLAKQMGELANKDALTSVKNRTAYNERIRLLEQDISDGTAMFAIVVVDINGLKNINDNYGHERGNDYIKATCRIICRVYAHSPVFRIGGDEFVVVLQGNDYEARGELLEQLLQVFADNRSNDALNPWEKADASAGMAVFDSANDTSVEQVFERADQAMYEHKQTSRG